MVSTCQSSPIMQIMFPDGVPTDANARLTSYMHQREKNYAQMRAALEEIRDKAAMMKNGGAWAGGLAQLCLAHSVIEIPDVFKNRISDHYIRSCADT